MSSTSDFSIETNYFQHFYSQVTHSAKTTSLNVLSLMEIKSQIAPCVPPGTLKEKMGHVYNE